MRLTDQVRINVSGTILCLATHASVWNDVWQVGRTQPWATDNAKTGFWN